MYRVTLTGDEVEMLTDALSRRAIDMERAAAGIKDDASAKRVHDALRAGAKKVEALQERLEALGAVEDIEAEAQRS